MALGLVLEGGGMRGLFTAGVLDELMEQGLDYSFQGAVGVSAGACFGVNMKSGQQGRALRYNIKMCGNPNYISVRSLLTTGNLINADFCYHVVPTQIDVFDGEAFARHPMKFHLVCTDCLTGQPIYHEIDHVDYDVLEWIRASASLPMVSRPVALDGHTMLDGGISDSIPLRYFQQQGYDRNIVILTQPLGYRKKPYGALWLTKLLLRRYPKVVECMKHRHEMYNAQLDYVMEQAKAGNTLIIAPPETLPIGRVEQKPEKLRLITRLGREACLRQLDEIKNFLAQR